MNGKLPNTVSGITPCFSRLYGTDHYRRCMEHSINVGAGAVINDILPTSSRRLLKKFRHVVERANTVGQDVDFEELEADLPGWDDDEVEDEDKLDNDDDDEDALDVADVVGKALALLTQV